MKQLVAMFSPLNLLKFGPLPNFGAPNELFCKKSVLQWVFCWENWSSFMCCWQDEIHLLWDLSENFLSNGHYRRKAAKTFFRTLDNLWKVAEIMDVRDDTLNNSLMLWSWLGKMLVSSSWKWRTPFDLPGTAVMRWQESSLSPGKFQAHCKTFLKVLRWVLSPNCVLFVKLEL